MQNKKGYLVLEDGTIFQGKLTGNMSSDPAEVVFNTSMVGYEQVISDPSYAGQIVLLTYPLIGNYGVNFKKLEAAVPWLKGLIVKELCTESHYEQDTSFEEYLQELQLPCLYDVDTRAITRHIRHKGTMGGIIVDSLEHLEDLIEKAKAVFPQKEDYVLQVSRKSISRLGEGPRRVVLLDMGCKRSISKALVKRGCELFIVPADTSAQEILKLGADGLVLSNGPGDPRKCEYAINTIKDLLGKMPIFGICLGHQLLALAMGGETYKMTFGHRGANHPVKDLRTQRVYITSQNHGYVVDETSLKNKGIETLFHNLHDESMEGFLHHELKLLSVQFHPEASPGPWDTLFLFDDFIEMMA